jgi:hypothetical protein
MFTNYRNIFIHALPTLYSRVAFKRLIGLVSISLTVVIAYEKNVKKVAKSAGSGDVLSALSAKRERYLVACEAGENVAPSSRRDVMFI